MRDGAELFHKDWGSGPVVAFSQWWPLNADAWDYQPLTLASAGYRAIAHDRRGHERSCQTWGGDDMSTYAEDLAALVSVVRPVAARSPAISAATPPRASGPPSWSALSRQPC